MKDDRELNEISQMLVRLRPAACELDAREVFYEAGFNASLAARNERRSGTAWLVAAALLAVAFTAPVTYRMGHRAATRPAEATRRAVANRPPAAAPTDRRRVESDRSPGLRPDSPEAILAGTPEKPLDRRMADQDWDLGRSIWSATMLTAPSIDRRFDRTLTASHAALVSPTTTDRDLQNFPFANAFPDLRFASEDHHDGSRSDRALVVSDVYQVTAKMETVR